MITPSYAVTTTERVLPKFALDFTTAILDPRVTFTRTTGASNPATFVNSSGVVALATNDQPRFDYNPITLACKGLLIEESRINTHLQSENLSAWGSPTNATLLSDVETAPDGNITADKLVETIATGNHFLSATSINSSYTSGSAYTRSCFLKADGRHIVSIYLPANYFPNNNRSAIFDLQAGTIYSLPSGVTASIEAYKNGWYRCAITVTATATGSSHSGGSALYNSAGNVSYLGDGTSGAYIWGAQLEAGAFPTSYIPTTTTSLTRNADVATAANQGVVAQGTFLVDATVVNSKTLLTSGSVTFVATASTAQKTAVAYDANSVNKSINSGTVTTSAGATASTDITLGNGGIFRKMAFYLPKLIDAELQAFSK